MWGWLALQATPAQRAVSRYKANSNGLAVHRSSLLQWLSAGMVVFVGVVAARGISGSGSLTVVDFNDR